MLKTLHARDHRRALLATIVGGALLLTGCSTGGSEPAAESTATTAESSVLSSVDYFYTAGDAPAEPTRVLALWRTGSALADLGVVPVGTLDQELSQAELTAAQWAEVEGVPSVGTFDGIDIEKVIALDPDLVVGMDTGGLGIDYDELAELYPVRILNVAEPTDVWSNYEVLAALTGKTSNFDEEEAALNSRLADIKSEYGSAVSPYEATQFNVYDGQITLSTSKSIVYERLAAAGFTYNPDLTDDPERYVETLTLENLPTLADQGIIFYQVNYDGSVTPDVQAILDQPAYQELPAVQDGRAYPVRGATIYTFAAANAMVDDILAAAEDVAAQG